MMGLSAHRKLLTLLCLLLLAGSSLMLLAGCGHALLPEEQARTAGRFNTYDQVIDSYEQVIPGTTGENDLTNLGFDTRGSNIDVLSYLGVEERFMPREGVRFEQLDPAVQDCIRAEQDCAGYVFHPHRSSSQRVGSTFMDVMGFNRVTHMQGWSAEIILLVENGRVVHKVFSGNPHAETMDEKRQPLGPLQDLGGALAHAAGSSF